MKNDRNSGMMEWWNVDPKGLPWRKKEFSKLFE
jgi:hypothetical protein